MTLKRLQAAFTNCIRQFINSWVFVHYSVINVLYIMARKQERELHGANEALLDIKEVRIMYEPENNYDTNERLNESRVENDASAGINDPPAGYTGDTDRESGEYHYKNGYTQKIYSDAHYVPADENTVPPRYYTPPEKPVREPKPKKPHSGRTAKIIALCLVCAILGGLGGAAIVSASVSSSMNALTERVGKLEDKENVLTTAADSGSAATAGTVSDDGSLTPSAIYDLACQQVVGISSEITYTNFFGMTSSAAVSGSGFILTSDGYVLTNYHVIETAYSSKADITVITHDGTKYTATVIGFEQENDIAVLKIEGENLPHVTIGDSDTMNVGDEVYAVGNPLGELDFSMTTGHISALDRLISTSSSSESINMFQFDAAVNSGNSGGPVYNNHGEVVGVVTAKYSSSGVEGLSFAIPINDAASIANDLITKGYVTGKAYMGISLRNDYNSMYANYYGWPVGAMVAGVNAGSCAEAAGIQTGDIITKVGDKDIESYSDLKSAIRCYSAGDTAEITLYRAGESMTVSITFDEAKPE